MPRPSKKASKKIPDPPEIDPNLISQEDAARVLGMEVKNVVQMVSAGGAMPAAVRKKIEAAAANTPRADLSEEYASGNKLSELTGIPERTITRRLADAGVALVHRHGYRLKDALRCIVADLEKKDVATAKKIEQAKLRKAEADAFTSEAEAARMAGLLAYRVDARKVWMDGFAQMRAIIEGFHIVPIEHRTALVKELMEVKLPSEEAEVGIPAA